MRTDYLSRCGLVMLLFLAVWNVGQAQDSLGMSCVSTLDYWSSASDIQMVGNLAYVVSGTSGLRIMDLTDAAHPQEIGRCTWYDWDDAVGGVYVTGTRAYVATTYGCCAFDISDPGHPVQLARWWEDRSQYDIFVHDTIAIIQIDDPSVVQRPVIADISDLGNVQQIGDFGNRALWPVGMAGDYLCMAGSEGGLLVFDISNPSQPVEVAQVDTTMRVGIGAIAGDYAYLGTLGDGVRIIDLSNPLQPVEVASCDSGECGAVTVTGTHLVISKYGCLDIWNVADPLHPVLEGVFTAPAPLTVVSGSGNLICAGYYYNPMSVAVVDISNPSAPVQVSSFGLIGFLSWMVINGTTGYVPGTYFPGTEGPGTNIMDLTDPVNPSFLGRIRARASDIAVRGNYAYIPDRNHGLVVFDVSNPAEPESLHCTPGGCPQKIVTAGDYAYVIDTDQGWPVSLHTYSLMDPTMPISVGLLSIPYYTMGRAFAARNGYLYIGASNASYVYILVYSVANPEAPQLVGTGRWVNYYWTAPFDLALNDHYAYVAYYTGGLVTLDITQPENPVVVSQMEGTTITEVAAIGNTVVTDGNSRINVLDMTDPTDPRYVGYYPTVEWIRDIKILGSYVITLSSCEFRVYQCDALSGMPSHTEIVPYEFALYPCYPNPFNPTTVIRFSLPHTEQAKLTIYNITGRQVKVLVNGTLNAGEHRVTFDGSELSSGVYFIRLEAGQHLKTEKMVLLK